MAEESTFTWSRHREWDESGSDFNSPVFLSRVLFYSSLLGQGFFYVEQLRSRAQHGGPGTIVPFLTTFPQICQPGRPLGEAVRRQIPCPGLCAQLVGVLSHRPKGQEFNS